MKPKLLQKRTGPDWQGQKPKNDLWKEVKCAFQRQKRKSVKTSEKTTVRQSKQSSARVRPFTGKVFYLDLQSNRTAETLERDIKELGGTVEKFFSKEIRYLVSNKRDAKYANCFRQDSPVPSPDSGPSSPHPLSRLQHVDNNRNGSQDQADTLVKSRGQSLVERVVKEQGRIQMDRILSKALEWGVKIIYIDDVLAYVQRKKKHFNSQVLATTAVKPSVKTESSAKQHWQKQKGGRISKPFVKVEDSSRHYCPVYLTMPNMPKFNLKAAAPCCPFCLEDKVPSGSKHRGHRGAKTSVNEEKVQGLKKSRDKKRGGYCECCAMKYNNLKTHLQSECHKAFSKSDEYSIVDKLVSTLHFNFIPIKTKVKRPKCTISSVVFVPEPSGGTAVSHRGGPDHSETVKVEERWAVQFKDSRSVRNEPSPSSASQLHSKSERWNCYTYSNRSKHKSLQNSLTFSAEKAEQVQSPQVKSETRREVDCVAQIPQKDTNCSISCLQSTNTQSEASPRHFKHEHMKNDEGLHESQTGTNLSEKEEENLYTDFSTVRRIQRRVRVYKHKRQKIDTNVKRSESGDKPDDFLLKLQELFQSSEDQDVEFHGFTD